MLNGSIVTPSLLRLPFSNENVEFNLKLTFEYSGATAKGVFGSSHRLALPSWYEQRETRPAEPFRRVSKQNLTRTDFDALRQENQTHSLA